MLNKNEGMPEPEKELENNFKSYLGDGELDKGAELSEIRKQRLAELTRVYYELREKLVSKVYHGSIADFIHAEDDAKNKIKNADHNQKPKLRPDQKVFEIINGKYREIIEGVGETPAKNRNKNEEKTSEPALDSEETELEMIIGKIKRI